VHLLLVRLLAVRLHCILRLSLHGSDLDSGREQQLRTLSCAFTCSRRPASLSHVMAPDSQRTAVPGLYLNAKYYLIGIISVSRLRWFGSESAEPHSLTGSLSASLLL